MTPAKIDEVGAQAPVQGQGASGYSPSFPVLDDAWIDEAVATQRPTVLGGTAT